MTKIEFAKHGRCLMSFHPEWESIDDAPRDWQMVLNKDGFSFHSKHDAMCPVAMAGLYFDVIPRVIAPGGLLSDVIRRRNGG